MYINKEYHLSGDKYEKNPVFNYEDFVTESKSFIDKRKSLNEAKKVSLGDMEFTVTTFADNRGDAIQFLPSGKTAKKFSVNEMVSKIQDTLKSKMAGIGEFFVYSIRDNAAGLVFRLDSQELTNAISKNI